MVDVESLKTVEKLLREYDQSLMVHIYKLKNAAKDCADNMGSDELSMEAVKKLNDCLPGFSRCCEKAELFRARILLEIQKIEDAGITEYKYSLKKY